jgi:oxygen-independent coproporphyrinogen-3 oxidase
MSWGGHTRVEVHDMSHPIPCDVLRRFDIPGPRYTSYPTADRFVEALGEDDLLAALQQRAANPVRASQPLSLYAHIPFCEQLCYYCACNKIITRKHERSAQYLQLLAREIDLYARHAGGRLPVGDLHLGGGSPTFLSDDELASLLSLLERGFELLPDGERSIEIDPRTVDAGRLKRLRELGFNRISFGVQDFDPQVQRAVHRVQPFEDVAELMAEARWLDVDSVNVDLIYGLPLQTAETFARTLAQVVQLRPDRIALYGYAHLPERFKPQRRIHAADLPLPANKLALLASALEAFQAAGYVYIGMDHFALPKDALAVAKREGRLHRNFQGYASHPDRDLVGLGVSAISGIGAVYAQNAKTMEECEACLERGRLPLARGFALSRDDLVRRAVIMALMCQGRVLFEDVEAAWLLEFGDYFAQELDRLRDFEQQGLVVADSHGIEVTATGWWVVRAIAMVFDRYLQADRHRAKFSQII